MAKPRIIVALGLAILGIAGAWLVWSSWRTSKQDADSKVVTSARCVDCHESFYRLWSTSHHGLAMQPVTAEFARTRVTPQPTDLHSNGLRYRAEVGANKIQVVETGADTERRFEVRYALGGKNVYYFLAPLDRGRLQVAPVAYNVRTREWFGTTESMVRHFPTEGLTDAPIPWTDRLLTFNTSCHSCHVSQLSRNYDPGTDSYQTEWVEPGINCETCHGPGGEHVRVCEEAGKDKRPKDLKLVVTSSFTAQQHNDACGSCHAKAAPLTESYPPGERFFDHFDLVTLEHTDYYPDGRDLGENYTLTSWRMSPCARAGKLHCVSCHTSSGRYRFREKENANAACLPCHEDKAAASTHTHHPADSEGSRCVSCHMPTTEFALMRRSDHSMLPPSPSATIAFKSPNACNICHTDKSPQWADRYVRQWAGHDYQAAVLRRGRLIETARNNDWSKLSETLAYLSTPDRDEIVATSLIRLLSDCPDPLKWPVVRAALDDPSPLVRAAAAYELRGNLTDPETLRVLLSAVGDSHRLVRIRAAGALAAYPAQLTPTELLPRVNAAMVELETSLQTRPDDWSLTFNLGNYYLDRGWLPEALTAFQRATTLRPDALLPWVNLSIAHARNGNNSSAEDALEQALKLQPDSAVANFNLALLKAESGEPKEAERLLRKAFVNDPNMAEAAYNLGVLLAGSGSVESLKWCRKAATLRPQEPKYSYTLAFYLDQAGRRTEAVHVLRDVTTRQPEYADAHFLLGELYERQGNGPKALETYRRMANLASLTEAQKNLLSAKIASLASQ